MAVAVTHKCTLESARFDSYPETGRGEVFFSEATKFP